MSAPAHRLRPVAPGVLVATSAFWSTTTTVLVAPSGEALLVDPGVLPDELGGLPAELAAASARVVAGACTHAHWDHVLWPGALAAVARHASAGTQALLTDARQQLVDQPLQAEAAHRGTAPWPAPTLDLAADPLADGSALPWAGPEVVAIVGDAHLPGHTSLRCDALGVLVLGDLLSDVDVPFPSVEPPAGGPGAVAAYRAGLDRLAEALHRRPGPGLVVPGHGTPTDRAGALRRLDLDRRYLDDLEAACASAATLEGAQARAAASPGTGGRLAAPDVRAAHEATVAALFARASVSEPGGARELSR